MFTIASNKTIRISRGDDSGRFPIVINKGTILNPIQYEFKSDVYVSDKSHHIVYIDLDKERFRRKVNYKNNFYSFYYSKPSWQLDGKEVNLEDYGISPIYESLESGDYFSVTLNKPLGECVQFYLFNVNSTNQEWLLRKSFYRNGDIISEYPHQIPIKNVDNNIIDEDGNMVLSLCKQDTDWLEPGEYRYFIRANLVNTITGKVETNTITNRLQFYVIDDDFDRLWY